MMLNKQLIAKVAKSAFAVSQNTLPCSSSMATVIAPAMQKRTKVTLPDLPYDYSALEPVISAEIMQLHHSKHHQTYVNNYNVASEKLAEAIAKGKNIIHINNGFLRTQCLVKMEDTMLT